jgi:hypothetical protein
MVRCEKIYTFAPDFYNKLSVIPNYHEKDYPFTDGYIDGRHVVGKGF